MCTFMVRGEDERSQSKVGGRRWKWLKERSRIKPKKPPLRGNMAPHWRGRFLHKRAPLCGSPVRQRLDLSFKGWRVADNTRVCSCQHGGIIYSIKSPGHADKQTGWVFIYETSRWQDNMAAGGLPVPHDPPVVASFMSDFIGLLFTCFQINCPFEWRNPLINRQKLKGFTLFVGSTPILGIGEGSNLLEAQRTSPTNLKRRSDCWVEIWIVLCRWLLLLPEQNTLNATKLTENLPPLQMLWFILKTLFFVSLVYAHTDCGHSEKPAL